MSQNVFDVDRALRFLKRRDKTLARVIRRAGDYQLVPSRSTDLFSTLSKAIISQQLSGKAAETIIGRFLALFDVGDKRRAPTPVQVLDTSEESLRGVGLSRAKTLAVKDLADKIEQGTLPTVRRFNRMDDEDIIGHLIQVRGIGRWTAEMFLMFHLGRPDVLPVDDLGVRKGFMLTYGLDEMPNRQQLIDHAECWRPYRSVASWYLWRAVDIALPLASEKKRQP